ncbi:DUF2281 domain-containing protein [Candidatus Electrothrix sp.]|uniref:DUF2281 domain-containing protein n=1 Tax=Candidatus Electrothrix sp. TaxID=2170559 RepID=UPI004057A14E
MNTQLAERKFRTLPDDLKREVLNFMDFLLAKRKRGKISRPGKFEFSWEGGLSHLKDKYNSVELQHQSMDWR